jgi:hypothetical protein
MTAGDRQAAARLLEEAARHVDAMNTARAEAARRAEAALGMLDASQSLERAIQMAMLGKDPSGHDSGDGSQGERPGNGTRPGGKDGALASRLAALGLLGGAANQPGTGPGGRGTKHQGEKRGALDVKNSVRAPSHVDEGQRAVAMLQGLGRGAKEAPAYREVFPSYDAAAEEGMEDEAVPAARRGVVRMYFESIRPGAESAQEARSNP